MRRLGYYLLLMVGMLFWGGSWVSGDIIVTLSTPMIIGFFRFLTASMFFLPVLLVKNGLSRSVSFEKVKYSIFLGMTGIFGYGMFFLVGMGFTTSAQGAIIAGMNPITVSLIAHIVHGERLKKRWQYSGFILSFAGVVLVVGVQVLIEFRMDYLLGNLLILCAMGTWGIYSSIGKAAMKTMSSLEATAGGVFTGTLFFGMGALIEGLNGATLSFDPLFWFNIFYLGFAVTFLGFMFYFIGVNNLNASNAAAFINFVPVFGVALSIIILHEVIHWTFLVGLMLIIGGVSIVNAFPSRDTSKEKSNELE